LSAALAKGVAAIVANRYSFNSDMFPCSYILSAWRDLAIAMRCGREQAPFPCVEPSV
jgi:hypothetical protein